MTQDSFVLIILNPLTPGVHEKVIHNKTYMQLKAAGFFK